MTQTLIMSSLVASVVLHLIHLTWTPKAQTTIPFLKAAHLVFLPLFGILIFAATSYQLSPDPTMVVLNTLMYGPLSAVLTLYVLITAPLAVILYALALQARVKQGKANA